MANTSKQITIWLTNLKRLKGGYFGGMQNEVETNKTLLAYFKAQAAAGYPLASENVKYYEDMVRKEEGITFDYPPCTCLSLRKKGRAAMRGMPLDRDCRTARTTTNEYGQDDDRVFCHGLYKEQSVTEIRDKCLRCKAYVHNAEPPQEDAE